MPCFGKVPNEGSTWHRPQIRRPPQTESMSPTTERAASRNVVSSGNRARRAGGVKMTSGSAATARTSASRGDEPAVDPAAPGLAIGRRLAVGDDPARAVGVVAHEDVGGHHGPLEVGLHRV